MHTASSLSAPEKAGARLFWVLLALLLPVLVLLSRDFGITWDEAMQNTYGELLWRFYASGGADKTLLRYFNLSQYGGFFDLACHLLQKLFSGLDPYDVRHMWNSVIGWGGLVFAGLLAKRMYGVGAGVLCVLLLAFSPRYIAHSMNNSKDLPFAVFYVGSLWAFSCTVRRFPYLDWKSLLLCILLPALAINVRVAGLLLLFYAGGLLACRLWQDNSLNSKKKPHPFLGCAAGFCVYAAVTLLAGTLFWPWALLDPFVRPFQALLGMSRFSYVGEFSKTVLFGGSMIPSDALPWDYLPRWIAITTPLGVLAGLAAVPFWARRAKLHTIVGLVAFAALFPIALVLLRHSRLYDGFRHMLFVYPPLVVLAAGAWQNAWSWAAGRGRKWLAGVALLFALGAYHPLLFQVREHPNQITYFNQIVGGTRGAFLRYELDYWGNSYKQAVDWLRSAHGSTDKPVTFAATIAGHLPQLYANRFPDVTYQFSNEPPDYIFALLRGAPGDITAILQDKDIVHVVQADGAPLCVVAKFPEEMKNAQ